MSKKWPFKRDLSTLTSAEPEQGESFTLDNLKEAKKNLEAKMGMTMEEFHKVTPTILEVHSILIFKRLLNHLGVEEILKEENSIASFSAGIPVKQNKKLNDGGYRFLNRFGDVVSEGVYL